MTASDTDPFTKGGLFAGGVFRRFCPCGFGFSLCFGFIVS